MTHPVVAALRERPAGSRVALVVEGGGMRGIPTWTDPTLVGELISRRRALLRRGPAVGVRGLVEERYERLSPGLFDAVLAGTTELHPIATEVETAEAVDLHRTIVETPPVTLSGRGSEMIGAMRSHRATILAWGLCALTLAAAALAAVLSVSVAGTDWGAILPAAEPPSEGVFISLLDAAWLVAFAGIGAFVASHRPRNPVGWLLGALPALLVCNFVGEAYYWYAAREDPRDPGTLAELGLWLANTAWIPAVIIVLVLLPLLFPTGRPPTPRWRVVAWLGGAAGAVLVMGNAFARGPLENFPWVDNPLGVTHVPGVVDALGVALWFASALAAAASLVVRFRRSHGVERQQLKWFTAAGSQLVVAFALSFSLAPAIGDDASWVIIATALLAVALAVAIGVLRYRLYDIDLVINRALVYGALSATLAATYLVVVLLVGLAVGRSGLAVAVSTLAVAGLFGPARSRIQAAVDRRFYRRRYDAARTLEAFGARLRDELDIEMLGADLRAVVNETVQPEHVSLWLRTTR